MRNVEKWLDIGDYVLFPDSNEVLIKSQQVRCPVSSDVIYCFKHQFYQESYRKRLMLAKEVSLNFPTADGTYLEEIVPDDQTITPDKYLDMVIDRDNASEMLTPLTVKQRDLIRAIVIDDKSSSEYASQKGVTMAAVSAMKRSALATLKKNLSAPSKTLNDSNNEKEEMEI